ncbi:hypothetical protein [Azotobacter beijerinckii]|uniref:Uncharacterized protein n=1 Tax=Azotobacter beijerinckii TaxID=170623 RepID=A0A1I4I2A5_9GAMM|nr:hypothetical protein [Azotobacter beijerinckii]SFL47951.1 hypothetical protein SAMN04244574_04435 [Azotobacter beijerinckii]
MDVLYFLKQRTGFIRTLYEGSVVAFEDRIRRIKVGEEPFVPPYSEDGEPPFLLEWIEADECRDVLGHACLSLLAASLQCYLRTSDERLSLNCGECCKSDFKQRGWLNGYRTCFRDVLNIDWRSGPCDLTFLEALVLARNQIQHPESIHTVRAKYSRRDFTKLERKFFFAGSEDMDLPYNVDAGEFTWILAPNIQVTRETLMQAVDEVEQFCTWLDAEIDAQQTAG